MSTHNQLNNRSHFEHGEYDFTPIYDTLKTYFPIENPTAYNEENIKDLPGLEKIGNILNEQFFNKKNYTQRWGTFKKHLKKQWKKPVEETMSAFYPCYSGRVIIHTEKASNLTYTKELHFFISLLGPYYTIIGIDKSEISLHEKETLFEGQTEEHQATYEAEHVITVSPYQEYENDFSSLQKQITEYFPDFRFVPFQINLKELAGVSLIYPDIKGDLKDSVFSLLFRPKDMIASVRGDERFGYEEWSTVVKLNPAQQEEVRSYLLFKASLNKDKNTLHKVWKLKSTKGIRPPSGESNILFGMQPIEVIDLSDSNLILLYTAENQNPISYDYSLIEKEIQLISLPQGFRFKIKSVDQYELVLIVSINMDMAEQNPSFIDVAETIFEVYK